MQLTLLLLDRDHPILGCSEQYVEQQIKRVITEWKEALFQKLKFNEGPTKIKFNLTTKKEYNISINVNNLLEEVYW